MPPQCPHPGGWTTAEAAARLAADGPNELPAAPAGLLAPAGRNRAAVPDAVPGGGRLGREQVLARSIPAIELLGATTVSCVDKTGTLTSNRMRLRRLWSEWRPTRAARRRQAFDPMEAAIGAAVSLLLVVLGVPGLRQLFAFAIPATGPLLLCCVVAAATLAWCTLLRRILASLSSGPR